MTNDWNNECTHLVMESITFTIKVGFGFILVILYIYGLNLLLMLRCLDFHRVLSVFCVLCLLKSCPGVCQNHCSAVISCV